VTATLLSKPTSINLGYPLSSRQAHPCSLRRALIGAAFFMPTSWNLEVFDSKGTSSAAVIKPCRDCRHSGSSAGLPAISSAQWRLFWATVAAIHSFKDTLIFFRQPLGRLLDRERKLEWIGRFAHGLGFTSFNSSAGRKHRNAKSFRGYDMAGLRTAKTGQSPVTTQGQSRSPHNACLAGRGRPAVHHK
jgi:hypothetical protein